MCLACEASRFVKVQFVHVIPGVGWYAAVNLSGWGAAWKANPGRHPDVAWRWRRLRIYGVDPGNHLEAIEGDATGAMIFVLSGINGSFLQLDRKSHRIIWCHRDNCRAQPKPEAGRRETDVHVRVRCGRGCLLRQ
jgi:hypothetical protein